MVFTANDFSNWQNFPKGLKVLLLLDGGGDGGGSNGFSAVETRSMLESMDYIVTTFTDEAEALSVVFNNPESFHIAIVEVNTVAENESFKFLEAAKDHLPTIMVSTDNCIATSMKCIALGAVEFLQKPLSPEKLNNIWQHVVHKAFKDGGSSVADALKPVKESVVSMLHVDTDMTIDEKDTAPSTPQITQGSRLLNGDCQENINCSMENVNSSSERENVEEQDMGESKLVDSTNGELDENSLVVKEEKEDSDKEKEKSETGDLRSEKPGTSNCHKQEEENRPLNKSSGSKNLGVNKGSRRKIDWNPELHKKFVHAVDQLGIDQAIPSRILELMKEDGLTRHNVASHLQKYRMHRRSILPKNEHSHRWIQSRQNQRNYNGFHHQHRPVMAYPVWGVPNVHHHPGAVRPVWPPPLPQLASSSQPPPWQWKQPYPTVNSHVWGCPVGPPVTGTYYGPPNATGSGFHYPTGAETSFKSAPVPQLDDKMIDEMLSEVVNNPLVPLPIGLKTPAMDGILGQLSDKGITTVASSSKSCLINGSQPLS